MKNLFNILTVSILIFVGCSLSDKDKIKIIDNGEVIASMQFTQSHEFLAEYKRTLTFYSKKNDKKTIEYPIDTGGDFPITVYRHKKGNIDYLRFKGGIYHLIFDLTSQDYVNEFRPIEGIFTDKIKVDKLPSITGLWQIGKDFTIKKKG